MMALLVRFKHLQVFALVWFVVLIWLSQHTDARLHDKSDDSDERESKVINAIKPLQTDLKQVNLTVFLGCG